MKLDPDQREVILLSKIEEMRYSEIASIMDISEGAVKVRIFRAMNKLKKVVTKVENESNVAKTQ